MSFRNMPLHLTVRADITKISDPSGPLPRAVPKFRDARALLRYHGCLSSDPPQILGIFRHSGTEELSKVGWTIGELARDGEVRVFELKFQGVSLSAEPVIEDCDPRRGLFEAILEQDTLLFEIQVGQDTVDSAVYPQRASLLLRLVCMVSP